MAYFAIEFISGKHTTTGTANPNTGNYNIAVETKCFAEKSEREDWVSKGSKRESVSKRELRDYYLGMSVAAFNEEVIDDLERELELEHVDLVDSVEWMRLISRWG